MKTSAMTHSITIKASKKYTQEELFNLLKDNGNFEHGGPEMKKYMGFMNIVFPGADNFFNVVNVGIGNTINIVQGKDSTKGVALSMALDSITSGFSTIFNVEGKKNAVIMESIGREIERLVT